LTVKKKKIPRAEHPQPQAFRASWLSLNGEWQYEETNRINFDGKFLKAEKFKEKIIVPFCRESELSGINRKGFIKSVWYKKEFAVPKSWGKKTVRLHFGAVDWHARVWVNDVLVGEHKGGQAPFAFDISKVLKSGDNTIIVNAFDDVRSGLQASGKQSRKLKSHGCSYTRTTGIWQSVWLEAAGTTYIEKFKVISDPDNKKVHLTFKVVGDVAGLKVNAKVSSKSKISATSAKAGAVVSISVPIKDQRLWSIEDPFLYDLELSLTRGKDVVDKVKSYFGQRKIVIKGKKVLINDKPVFQRLVLDQGYYPDGIWTAATEENLKKDIQLSMAAGFNGARLHQKVFEPRFFYWADKLGYLVWGEFANWGLNLADRRIDLPILNEWRECVERDINHPSLIGWCPFNETAKDGAELQNAVVDLTKSLDPTRPVIDSSGWYHSTSRTDVYDAHDYDQNPESFKKRWDSTIVSCHNNPADEAWAPEKPVFISEYGGIGWYGNKKNAWGYGNSPKTKKEFMKRYEGLTNALLDNPDMFGLCYTQLTDVEQEQNGIYTYGRKPKFDIKKICPINKRKAAYEEESQKVE